MSDVILLTPNEWVTEKVLIRSDSSYRAKTRNGSPGPQGILDARTRIQAHSARRQPEANERVHVLHP